MGEVPDGWVEFYLGGANVGVPDDYHVYLENWRLSPGRKFDYVFARKGNRWVLAVDPTVAVNCRHMKSGTLRICHVDSAGERQVWKTLWTFGEKEATMTDISQWPELVQVVKLRVRKFYSSEMTPSGKCGWQDDPDGPIFGEYVTIPLNTYTLAHVLGMLARTEDNGDWHGELIAMCCAAMDKAGYAELSNNWGDEFTFEEVVDGSFIAKIRADTAAERQDGFRCIHCGELPDE